jgi:hypothetical protein
LAGFATTSLAGMGVTGWGAGIATGGDSDLDSGAGGAGTTRVFMALADGAGWRLQTEPVSDKASQCDSNTATSKANKVRSRIGKLERVGALAMLQYTASAVPRLAERCDKNHLQSCAQVARQLLRTALERARHSPVPSRVKAGD